MPQRGCQFRERFENEAAFGDARVRDHQAGDVDHGLCEQKDIDIDQARSVESGGLPADGELARRA